MKISTFDLGWLVGIIEGEGCIFFNNSSPSSRSRKQTSFGIVVYMTDEDVIARVANLIAKPYSKILKKNKKWKDVYRVGIYGENAVPLLKKILPFLGNRRKAKAIQVLKAYEINCSKRKKAEKKRKLRNEKIVSMYKTKKYNKLELGQKFGLTNIRPILKEYGLR
jgi:hypothetical protein